MNIKSSLFKRKFDLEFVSPYARLSKDPFYITKIKQVEDSTAEDKDIAKTRRVEPITFNQAATSNSGRLIALVSRLNVYIYIPLEILYPRQIPFGKKRTLIREQGYIILSELRDCVFLRSLVSRYTRAFCPFVHELIVLFAWMYRLSGHQ